MAAPVTTTARLLTDTFIDGVFYPGNSLITAKTKTVKELVKSGEADSNAAAVAYGQSIGAPVFILADSDPVETAPPAALAPVAVADALPADQGAVAPASDPVVEGADPASSSDPASESVPPKSKKANG